MANIAGEGVPAFSERDRPSSAFLFDGAFRQQLPVTAHDLQVGEPQAYGTPSDCAIYPNNVQGLSVSAQMPKSTNLVDYLPQGFSVIPSNIFAYNEADFLTVDPFVGAGLGTQSFQNFKEPSPTLQATDCRAHSLGSHAPLVAAFPMDQVTPSLIMPSPALLQTDSALGHGTRHPHEEHISAQPSGNRLNCTQPGCNKTFGRSAEFRRHLRTVHQRRDASDYRCLVSFCDYAYPRADKVRSHMAKAHGLRLERVSKAGKADAEEMDEE